MFPKDIIQEFLNTMNEEEKKRKEAIASALERPVFNFEIPAAYFPEIKADYKRIEKIIRQNSKYGWTLTQEIEFAHYLKDEHLTSSLRQIDDHFYRYYSRNNWMAYYETKETILETINPKWTELLNECFDSFEQDKYKSIIPTLFSIIEGETAFIYRTDDVGRKLFETMEEETQNKEHELTKFTILSLFHLLRWEMFKFYEFKRDRKGVINRNWVLHGRDDPKHWRKVDALRLINILSTIQLVKEHKDS